MTEDPGELGADAGSKSTGSGNMGKGQKQSTLGKMKDSLLGKP